MSLQLWLPFNGSTQNYGLLPTLPSGNVTYGGLGKTGVQGLKSSTKVSYDISEGNISTHCMSFSFWAKSDVYTGTSTTWWQLCTFKCADNTSFHVYCVSNARYKIEYNPELNCYCDTSKWHHLTYVLNGVQLEIYLDGVYATGAKVTNVDRFINSMSFGVGTVLINDFKLYDHCLTIQEIERDYNSLLIHYPLRDPYVENTTNLLSYPTPGAAYAPAWDATLHPDAIQVSGWSPGYNSGVGSPAEGYHAYWKLIDDIPTMVMQDLNAGHRWLGISSNVKKLCEIIGPGNKYTISFEAKSDVLGKKMHGGLHYKLNGASSNGFNDGTVEFALTKDWVKYSFTKTLSSSADTSSSGDRVYIYGHTSGPQGIVYVRNVQMEINDHATPYSVGERVGEQLQDCSGRGYDSVSHGALTVSKDSIRNTNCTCFTSNNSVQIPSPYSAGNSITEFSIAMWLYLDSTNSYMQIFSTAHPTPTNSNGGWFTVNCEGCQMWFYSGGTYWKTGTSSSMPTKEWHHVGMTFKDGVVQHYYDGEPFGSPITQSKTAISSTAYLALGDSYTATTNWGGAPFNGKISDFRFYGTAISAECMKELYQNSTTVDKNGNIHSFEFVEG